MISASVDQRQLNYFLAVARLQNMRRAADEMGISESTLSRSIARLEASYGVPLFDRLRRGLRLNEFGRAFSLHAERALHELDLGHQELCTMRERSESVVGLAFVPKLGSDAVPRVIMAFKALRTDVRFRLYQSTGADLRNHMLSEHVDFCIAGSRFDDAAMVSTLLWADSLTAVVAVDHPLAQQGVIRLRDIASEPLLTYCTGYTTRQSIDDFARANGLALNVVFESADFHALTRLASVGYGIAIVPGSARDQDPNTVAIPLLPESPISIRLFALRGRALSPTARVFRHFAINYFGCRSA